MTVYCFSEKVSLCPCVFSMTDIYRNCSHKVAKSTSCKLHKGLSPFQYHKDLFTCFPNFWDLFFFFFSQNRRALWLLPYTVHVLKENTCPQSLAESSNCEQFTLSVVVLLLGFSNLYNVFLSWFFFWSYLFRFTSILYVVPFPWTKMLVIVDSL